ncbi:MAG: alpha-glucan family phosphorylase [Gemmatimonadota bacterium]
MSHRQKIPYLPDALEGLAELATNLWWSWHLEARALFASIDPILWRQWWHNPIALLRKADPARLAECASDPQFLQRYHAVQERMRQELTGDDTWFHERHPDLGRGRPIAYFCAEFALHNSVPIYSGGLGVLAGDHCKAISDLGVPFVGVGLLYAKGYFDQKLTADGWQVDGDEPFDTDLMPLTALRAEDGSRVLATLPTGDRDIHIGAWEIRVGRTRVILLDTDLEENHRDDRALTSKLYGGGRELRLKQEWILGVGGVRVLRALGVRPGAWHANEGHAAFMLIERLREYLERGMGAHDAVARVRAHSVFTTHTPVPAGHDTFQREQIESCIPAAYWEGMGMDTEGFLSLGRHPEIDHQTFHMTAAAIRLCQGVNGVSERHGLETRRIWQSLWPGVQPEAVPIGHVTNGVHMPTWMSAEIRLLLDRHLGHEWRAPGAAPELWDRVLEIPDRELWHTHVGLKKQLFRFIREQSRRRWTEHWDEPAHLAASGTLLDPDALTLGFARRFATYKRADLLLRSEGRLLRLLTNARRPVQIVFAGKAHPADDAGKQVLQRIYQLARDPKVEGRVAFLEDYELHLAHRLYEGVDVWLNLPRVPLEACGTSGMKAALNGVPQLATLDGWWAEGFTGKNGWAIPLPGERSDVDEADWDHLFTLLEDEVLPLYHERDADGVPHGWAERMKHAIREAGRNFTAGGMIERYVAQYYVGACRGDAGTDLPPHG